MVATTWRDTSIRPRSLDWISVLGGFPVRVGLAFVFESIVCYYVTLNSPPSYVMPSEAPNSSNTMAQRCAICGKGPQYGHNVSHSKVRTKRRFMPNLHKARVAVNGRTQTALICTRCLRTQAKASS
jgi:large subunit ribosomal protein L28